MIWWLVCGIGWCATSVVVALVVGAWFARRRDGSDVLAGAWLVPADWSAGAVDVAGSGLPPLADRVGPR